MAKSNIPRKHHYLPQFYLKGFSVDGEGLYQVDRSSGRAIGVRIKDTAAIRDFHHIDGGEVADPQALEKALAVAEGELAPHLVALLGGKFHDRATQMYVAQLVSMLRLRVPAVRDHIQVTESAFIHSQIRMMEAAGKLPRPPELGNLTVNDFRIEVMNWAVMARMFTMASDENVLATYYALKPTLLHAPMGERFITSDQPVALYHPEASDLLGIGPETPGVVISVPLSSRAALLLEHGARRTVDRLATSAEVAEINRRTALLARQWIFTGEAPDTLVPLLENVRDKQAGFIYEEIPTKGGIGHLLRYVGIGPNRTSQITA